MAGQIDTDAHEPERQRLGVLALLSTLMGFASISTDLYLPAFPAMERAFQVDAGMMEFTISSYLIGFSVGQLFWGTVSDRYGRRLPLAIGIVIFVIGSAGCALSSSIWHLLMWRVIQALGACAGVVLGRAVVSDLYKGRRAAQTLSTLASVTAIAPLIGPIIGGQILRFASWHTLFWVLMLIGIATLVFLSILPETLEPARRRRESPWHAVMAYLQLLRHRAVIAYAGVGACFYAGVFAYVAGSPAAYITYYHLSPQHYGVLFGLGIVGIMASNQINKRLVMRFGSVRLLWVGVGGLLLAAFILQVNVWTGWGGLAALALPLFAFIGMNGFIVANSIARAFSHFPERAGAVSALIGTLHYAVSILGATLVGLFADGTPRSLGSVVGLSAIGVLVCLGLTPKHD